MNFTQMSSGICVTLLPINLVTPLILTNLCPKSLSQKKIWRYLENANPVTGAGHGAWRQSVVTFHLGVGDVGPGYIQEVDSTPGWCPAQ